MRRVRDSCKIRVQNKAGALCSSEQQFVFVQIISQGWGGGKINRLICCKLILTLKVITGTQHYGTLNCFMQSLKKTQQQTKLFLCLLNKAWKNSDKSRRSRVCPDKGGRRSPPAMEMQFSAPGLICSSFKAPGLGDHRAESPSKSTSLHWSSLQRKAAGGLLLSMGLPPKIISFSSWKLGDPQHQ